MSAEPGCSSLRELQEKIQHFIDERNIQVPLAARLLDLTSELGEVAKAYLERTAYGKRAFTPDAHWAEELGDLTFVLLCLAAHTEVDLDLALEQALRKYDIRVNIKGHAGSTP